MAAFLRTLPLSNPESLDQDLKVSLAWPTASFTSLWPDDKTFRRVSSKRKKILLRHAWSYWTNGASLYNMTSLNGCHSQTRKFEKYVLHFRLNRLHVYINKHPTYNLCTKYEADRSKGFIRIVSIPDLWPFDKKSIGNFLSSSVIGCWDNVVVRTL